MKTRYEQRGMTAIGWLLVLGLIAFFTLITLRLVPLYLEHTKIVSVLESLEKEPRLTKMTKAEIYSIISKRFDVNDVRNVPVKDVIIVSDGRTTKVGIDYERRTSLFSNIDLVASFSKHIEVVAH
ncbi:MAG: DUF4845 domain-containing protein [Thiogranum sp.]|nr:DUF4845 domain-containing protein [Thiogranum sp.]